MDMGCNKTNSNNIHINASLLTTIELNPDSYNSSVDKINLENNLLKVYINNDLFVFDLENLKIK
jgi:hypothetical protein